MNFKLLGHVGLGSRLFRCFVCSLSLRRLVMCAFSMSSHSVDLPIEGRLGVWPQTRGSVDYLSTRGIQVDIGLLDTTSENRAESPLYEELYPNTVPAYPVPNSAI